MPDTWRFDIMTDKEIIEYYGQIWDNVKHIKPLRIALRRRYKEEC